MNLVGAVTRLEELLATPCTALGFHLYRFERVDDLHSPWLIIGPPPRVDSFVTLQRPGWEFELSVGVDTSESALAFDRFLTAIDAHDPASLLSQIIDRARTAEWGSFNLGAISTGTDTRGQGEFLVARIPLTVIPQETP